jgi:hypothetical protein
MVLSTTAGVDTLHWVGADVILCACSSSTCLRIRKGSTFSLFSSLWAPPSLLLLIDPLIRPQAIRAALRAAFNYCLALSAQIEFGAGYDNRKGISFRPVDQSERRQYPDYR